MKEKGNLKAKSISIILVFVMLFQYISILLPFLNVNSMAADNTTYTSEDYYGITWDYELDDENNAINIRPTYSVSGSVTLIRDVKQKNASLAILVMPSLITMLFM